MYSKIYVTLVISKTHLQSFLCKQSALYNNQIFTSSSKAFGELSLQQYQLIEQPATTVIFQLGHNPKYLNHYSKEYRYIYEQTDMINHIITLS